MCADVTMRYSVGGERLLLLPCLLRQWWRIPTGSRHYAWRACKATILLILLVKLVLLGPLLHLVFHLLLNMPPRLRCFLLRLRY